MLGLEIRNFRARVLSMVRQVAYSLMLLTFVGVVSAQAQNDPLPSWNDGAAKTSVKSFIAEVSTPGNAKFVPPEDRIAVFDNAHRIFAPERNVGKATGFQRTRLGAGHLNSKSLVDFAEPGGKQGI